MDGAVPDSKQESNMSVTESEFIAQTKARCIKENIELPAFAVVTPNSRGELQLDDVFFTEARAARWVAKNAAIGISAEIIRIDA